MNVQNCQPIYFVLSRGVSKVNFSRHEVENDPLVVLVVTDIIANIFKRKENTRSNIATLPKSVNWRFGEMTTLFRL
jgi:hypothetical protein